MTYLTVFTKMLNIFSACKKILEILKIKIYKIVDVSTAIIAIFLDLFYYLAKKVIINKHRFIKKTSPICKNQKN